MHSGAVLDDVSTKGLSLEKATGPIPGSKPDMGVRDVYLVCFAAEPVLRGVPYPVSGVFRELGLGGHWGQR